MNNLRTNDLTLNDPFESMFRGFLAPIRFDRNADELDIRVDVLRHQCARGRQPGAHRRRGPA